MTTRWIFNTTDRVWELYISGRPEPIFNIKQAHEPVPAQTRRILVRLTRYFPWLADAGREAAA